LSFFLSGCAAGTATGPGQGPQPGAIELLMLKAGFEIVPDTHPKCEKFCRQLPAGQIVPHKKGDQTIYGYVSPETKRIYVGNEADYQRFINLAVMQKIEERHRPVADERTDPEFWQMWLDSQGGG
jgi:hypothetical protein